MTASAKERLDAVTAELKLRGAVDVRLTLSPEAAGLPFDQVATDVAAFLEAYLRGEARPLDFIDAELPTTQDDFELKNLASSEFENAMSFGITRENFERLALDVARKVNAAHVRQRQALLPILSRVLSASVEQPTPVVTREVLEALLHARRHGQQPCEDPSDSVALVRASSELLRSVNAAWRSLGLKPSISENAALALVANSTPAVPTKT